MNKLAKFITANIVIYAIPQLFLDFLRYYHVKDVEFFLGLSTVVTLVLGFFITRYFIRKYPVPAERRKGLATAYFLLMGNFWFMWLGLYAIIDG